MKKSLPIFIEFDQVKDVTAEIYTQTFLESQNNSEFPSSVKQQIISLTKIIQRSKEEQCLLKEEMYSTINYYKSKHSSLYNAFQFDVLSHGIRSVVVKEGLNVEQKLFNVCEQFSNFIEDVEVPTNFKDILEINNDQTILEEHLDSDTDINDDETDSEETF